MESEAWTADEFAAWLNGLRLEPATLRKYAANVGSIFAHAHREGWIDRNP